MPNSPGQRQDDVDRVVVRSSMKQGELFAEVVFRPHALEVEIGGRSRLRGGSFGRRDVEAGEQLALALLDDLAVRGACTSSPSSRSAKSEKSVICSCWVKRAPRRVHSLTISAVGRPCGQSSSALEKVGPELTRSAPGALDSHIGERAVLPVEDVVLVQRDDASRRHTRGAGSAFEYEVSTRIVLCGRSAASERKPGANVP